MGDIQRNNTSFDKMRPMLISIAKGISRQFGSDCEVVVHNLSVGIEHTIEYIENGHVTGRNIGDDASEIVLKALREGDVDDRYDYLMHAKDGRMLKSSTIAIRDDDGALIGLFSINYDISNFILLNKTVNEFVSVEKVEEDKQITSNVSDLLEILIEESRNLCGKPVSAMTKEDKTVAIQYLDSKGAFMIKKSTERVSEYYGISKFTLYSYLGNDPGGNR